MIVICVIVICIFAFCNIFIIDNAKINLPFCYFRAFQIETKLYTYTFPFILYPLNHISFLASIYITVAMAYERYIAVCRPLHYRDVTTRYTVQRRTIGYATKRFIENCANNFILLVRPIFLNIMKMHFI